MIDTLSGTCPNAAWPALPLADGNRHFDIALDFVDHRLVGRSSDGRTRSMPLAAGPVAEFYGAYYHPTIHEWILPCDAVRRSPDPDATLLEFCESAYARAADLGHWDQSALERVDGATIR